MKVVKEKDVNIGEIVEVLESGGMVAFPCETVYGAGVDATNEEAVKKLSEYKKRPLGKPFSVVVTDMKMASKYVDLNQTARGLYKRFLPGPMTVISQGKQAVAPGVESETGTLGVRISSHPLVGRIVKALGKPMTATSANRSYEKRPYKISDFEYEKFDLVIDAGNLPPVEPSTVVDTTLDDATVLRQGEIKLKEKNEIVSRSEENTRNLGKELWQKYQIVAGARPIVFALEGEMGTGKTQFVKGLAKAMGITEEITSPTYNIEEDYEGLRHIDAWRMHSTEELEELGLEGKVIAIEWADRVAEVIRKRNEEAVIVWIKIVYGKGKNERTISWGTL